MIVELGPGRTPSVDGATSVDKRGYPGVDYVQDIEDGLPFSSGVVDRVVAVHVLEHLNDLPRVMEEIHRVLVDGGVLSGRVPHYRDRQAYDDPTHEQLFTTNSFDYWDVSTNLGELNYFDVGFVVEKCSRVSRIQFWRSRPIDFELVKTSGSVPGGEKA